MKKIIPIVVAIALVASLFTASCAPKEEEEASPSSITIVDSAGRVVEIPQPLERIAIWTGPTAEVIRALGAKDKIVGIADYMATKYAYYWPELKDKPQISSSWEPDFEKVIDVEPQVIFTFSSRVLDEAEALEPAGIKVVVIECYKWETLTRDIKTMGLILGKEKEAEELDSFLQSKIDLIEGRVKDIKPEERKRVYLEKGNKDYATLGPGSFEDKILVKVGGINIFADLGVARSDVDPEEILVKDPEVVIKVSHGAKVGGYAATDTSDMEAKRDEMMNRPGWSELKAVKDGQVYIQGCGLGGPAVVINSCYIAKLLYPDIFADLDVEAFHREYYDKYQGVEFKGIYLYPKPF